MVNGGQAVAPGLATSFNQFAQELPLSVQLTAGAAVLLSRAQGFDAVLARLLSIVFEAMRDGSWERIKICPGHGCRWAFYDASKNQKRTWCSMAVCGNRAKVRSYQERKRLAAPDA